ncbi:conjugal transfer protein TraF [Bdellovibrionota bacterium FG-2]
MIGIVLFLIAYSARVAKAATDFNYFSGAIDYWNEPVKPIRPQTSTPVSRTIATPTSVPETKPDTKEEPFSWSKHLDPKNKEFFKEGDYTPPEPFLEVIRNPNDENIKNWFAYIDKKNELARRLQERFKEYLGKKSGIPPERKAEITATIQAKIEKVSNVNPEAKRYRFRLYFDSHCPHCQHMLQTMTELQRRGFYVDARQIDTDTKGLEGLTFPVERAKGYELTEKNIKSVPYLLVGDLKRRLIIPVAGYESVDGVLQKLSTEKE